MSIRCLHPSGRVRRKPFWLWVITFWVLGGIVTAVFSDTITEISSGLAYSQVNGGFSFLICYALLYIANFFIHIQRLHDAGHSGSFPPSIRITTTVLTPTRTAGISADRGSGSQAKRLLS